MLKATTIEETSIGKSLSLKLKDYFILIKFRLSFIVVFSAGIGYLFAGGDVNGFMIFLLAGFLITAASNAINQIIESDTDRLMQRTSNRPVAAMRMQHTEAILTAGLMAIAGIAMMWHFFNALSALLGALSLLSYAFLYTPLKKVTPIAVFVGAIPGAMPPVIGCAAASGGLNEVAFILFAIQFLWQFPHFWAIAWVSYNDYAKAGFYLLPSASGKTKSSAFHVVAYTLVLLPVSLLPYMLGITGTVSAIIIFLTGLGFLYQALKLYHTCQEKPARSLMLGSFLYAI